MKWRIVYFEQVDTNQPAEVFEDALLVMSSKLRGKLLQVTDALRFYGHQLGGGYIEKCHDYEGEYGRFVLYIVGHLFASFLVLTKNVL